MNPREQIRGYTDTRLRATLRFYDCERLRGFYTGLLTELRAELARRARGCPAAPPETLNSPAGPPGP